MSDWIVGKCVLSGIHSRGSAARRIPYCLFFNLNADAAIGVELLPGDQQSSNVDAGGDPAVVSSLFRIGGYLDTSN